MVIRHPNTILKKGIWNLPLNITKEASTMGIKRIFIYLFILKSIKLKTKIIILSNQVIKPFQKKKKTLKKKVCPYQISGL